MLLFFILLLLVSCSLAANPAYEIESNALARPVRQIGKSAPIGWQKRTQFGLWI